MSDKTKGRTRRLSTDPFRDDGYIPFNPLSDPFDVLPSADVEKLRERLRRTNQLTPESLSAGIKAGKDRDRQRLKEALGERPPPGLVAEVEELLRRGKMLAEFARAKRRAPPDTLRRIAATSRLLRGQLLDPVVSLLALDTTLEQRDGLPFGALLGLPKVLDAVSRAATAQASNARVGRPPDLSRARFAIEVGRTLQRHGRRVVTTEGSCFPRFLSVILKTAGFTVPRDLRPLVRKVVRQIKRG